MSVSEDEPATRRALVLYGTETGNAQDIAYELEQVLRRYHFITKTRELDGTSLPSLLKYDLVVFAISTTGQGDFPYNARKFWLSLLRKKLSATSLATTKYAIVGLCDSSYPKFNLAARKLNKRLQQLGATSIIQPCDADEQGEEGTEGAFLAWLPLFQEQIVSCFPLLDSQTPIPVTEKLPSPWLLTRSSSSSKILQTNGHLISSTTAQTYLQSTEPSFVVNLENNDRVTPIDHWQDVRLLKLRADRLVEYMPGDALAIRPQNSPADVQQLIDIQGWQGIADLEVSLINTSAYETEKVFDPIFAQKQSFTLRQLLTEYLDINAIPRRSFFAKISHLTEDEMQKERALEFTDPQYLDEYFDYATRPRRSILEVLQEFDTVKIPWTETVNIFPIMRPRQFSIASGGTYKEGGFVFELLIAIVKYRTVIKRIREGVCTRYIAQIPVGTSLNVVLHPEGRFHQRHADLQRPHLLIGGGTGIAPLRSIIQEKIGNTAPSMLIFGCRNADSDYFFGEEWEALGKQAKTGLCVIPAFSRNQPQKIYVQDKIREHAELISKFVAEPNSMIVVCGSSGAMPKAVRQALKDVLAASIDSPISEEDAEDMLLRMDKDGRYKQETW